MAIRLENTNFAKSTLAADITNIGTSLSVQAGDGTKFASYPARAVIWSSAYASPTSDTSREVVEITNRSTDTLTITRAQESTSNKAWSSGDNIAIVITSGKVDELETELEYIEAGIPTNVYLSRGANNVLNVYARSNTAAPTTSHAITVPIPDGNGLVRRKKTAAVASGANTITMADGTSYWNRTSANGSRFKAYVYAIWSTADSGIVWALGGYSGFSMVSTTTTATDDDYFLLETSSTYTRAATDYCVCIGSIYYEYDTGDTPDNTIQTSAPLQPNLKYCPPSDYGYSKKLAADYTVAGGNISNYVPISLVVKQSGDYLIIAQAVMGFSADSGTINMQIRSGSATYGSATTQSIVMDYLGAAQYGSEVASVICRVESGDTIHMGCNVTRSAASGNTSVYGTGYPYTVLTFRRVDNN